MQQTLEQDRLLHRITSQIRQSLNLEEILNTAATEVRLFLDTDRVKIYQFYSDGHGQVIAESIHQNRLPSLLGLHFPADDIPPQARELFLTARQRSIVNLETQQIGLSCAEQNASDIRYRPVDPCHIEYLRAMGVQSSVVVPILQAEQLWGLLVSHNVKPRSVTEAELQFLQSVVNQLEIAITQATLVKQIQQQVEHEAKVNRISRLLHADPRIQLQHALAETTTVLQGTAGRLYLLKGNDTPEIYTIGEQPAFLDSNRPLEQHYLWQSYLRGDSDQTAWAVKDLYQEPAFRTLTSVFQATSIRGLLVIPLHYGQQCLGCLTVFRPAIETETLWAGQFDPDRRQTMPRDSFLAWRELKGGQTQPWTETDLKLAQAVGEHFSMAVQQYYLYHQVQSLNTGLERQVQERTATLQQAIDRQKALASVVAKIRASLDLTFIFQATVREVRQLLNADRVAIFCFEPNSNWEIGEFIAEDVQPEFMPVLGFRVQDYCFSQNHALHYHQGQLQAIADLEATDLASCHMQALHKLQIKASLVIPLLESDYLWGLLCIHHCEHPHQWTDSEIEFAQQIAAQLGVALQQAKLLTQTQQQAEQLAQALHDLQSTQSQLVQTEKMSSLGQLVAGIAHEINNPVNFIYGNLDYAQTYAESLLRVIALYQLHYPEQHPEIQAALEAIDFDFLTTDFSKILTSMKIGADRIRQIVQSLRNFSRLDQAERKPVDLHEGIDSTLLILQHRLKANGRSPGIDIIKDYSELPLIECYAGQLNQVFMNILSNAIDALESRDEKRTPEAMQHQPSWIKIRTALIHNASGQKCVMISISDNGAGIPETVQSRIFDPFFTTKPVGRGTGLGLAISYQVITEKHGGTLQCHSQPGQGTEFRIELPISYS
ncbi:MAG: GAF domain-containing protein [Leptolyngbya sp. IPPAS B-1204]|nr:MAG: GAF domain-containing protein [Leptolyngbya sp. IPPAS B-1204]